MRLRTPLAFLALLALAGCAGEDTQDGLTDGNAGANGPGNGGNGAATSDGGSGGSGASSDGGSGGSGASSDGGSGGSSSCSDGSQNGDETDVDCGGSCVPCMNGSGCAASDDCSSGFCSVDDGLCCSTACAGPCEGCTQAETGSPDGTCAPVAAGTECGEQSCVNGTLTEAATCSAAGACVPGAMSTCSPYACDPVAMDCKTACTSDADCTAPATCNLGLGTCSAGEVTFDTHNFMGMTEYPLDTDVCQCCGATTTAETAQAFCVLAGMTTAVDWTTGMISGTNCYCWDCISVNSWANNCCSGLDSRPMILTVTCQ